MCSGLVHVLSCERDERDDGEPTFLQRDRVATMGDLQVRSQSCMGIFLKKKQCSVGCVSCKGDTQGVFMCIFASDTPEQFVMEVNFPDHDSSDIDQSKLLLRSDVPMCGKDSCVLTGFQLCESLKLVGKATASVLHRVRWFPQPPTLNPETLNQP